MGIVLLALAVWAPEARAQSLADEADVHFQEGAKAYDRYDYEQALMRFMQSNRLSPNAVTAVNVGHTYVALERFPEAYRWYALARSLSTEARTTANIEAAMRAIEGSVVLMELSSQPPGAKVYLNQKSLGAVATTPATIAVAPGEYTAIFELEGYQDLSTEAMQLRKLGDGVDVDVELAAITGMVRIEGGEGATAHVGSETAPAACELPCTLQLPIGQQILYFKRDGYRSQPALLKVEEGAEEVVRASLSRITGGVVVEASERGAQILIDGEPVGFTPAVLLDVPVGSRTLTIRKPGFRPYEQQIEVSEDQRVDLGSVALSPTFTVSAASRTAEDVREAPASVSVITAEEIRAFGYVTVYEALGGLRGVYQTNDLTYQAIGVRGFSRTGDYGNRLLTTIDGHTANDDQIGSSYIGTDFLTDLSDVQQIEMVRGPGSALYGSNAVFGVVNLQMRDQTTENRPHANVSATDGILRAKAGAGFGDDDLGGFVSMGAGMSNGRDYEFPVDPADGADGTSTGADRLRQSMVMGKVWAGDFTLSAAYYGRAKGIPTGSYDTLLGDRRAKSNDYRAFIEGKYTKKLSDVTTLDVRLYGDGYTYDGAFPYEPEYVYLDRYLGAWVGVEPRITTRVADSIDLTFGAETRQHFLSKMRSFETESLDEEPFATTLDERPTFQVYSAYGVAEYVGSDLFRLNLGGRFDFYNTAVEPLSSFNPRAAVILTPGDEVIKLMGGTAFRAPSPYEYFYNDGGIAQVRPDSLSPESILTVEGEWGHDFSDVVRSTVGGYYNRIDRLIDTVEVEGEDVFQFDNVGDILETVGAEAELARAWRGGWMLAGQVSWQRTRIGGLVDGDPITNSPDWLASLKWVLPLGPTTRLANRWRVESPRLTNAGGTTPIANLVDLTLSGELVKPDFQWAVGVRNLLDTRVMHPGGLDLPFDRVPQPGRDFYVSLTAQL